MAYSPHLLTHSQALFFWLRPDTTISDRVDRLLTHGDAQAGVVEKMQMGSIELQIHRVA
jgi:hypothetical protein